MSEIEKSTGMMVQIERRGEVAIAAMAAKAKAEVEARYTIALHRPRNINQTRVSILESCKRPKFAEGARYRKPVGGKNFVEGLSIRFAEEAIKAMTNICVESSIVYEDSERRNIRITVTDLESNTSYGDDVIIAKTVERKFLKEGQEKMGERMNSYGDKVYLVAATEDDMANKVNAAKSKIIRNSGLRMVPQDILEEAEEMILKTLEKGGQDPKAETKKVCDAFATIGVKPSELERLLGHSLESISPKELVDLRATYSAVKDGETTWSAVIGEAEPKKPSNMGPNDPQPAGNPPEELDPKLLDNPIQTVHDFAKRDGVTEEQIVAFCKSKRLCGVAVKEVGQMATATQKQLVTSWSAILPDLKSTKA